MSEVDLKQVTKLYDENAYARVLLDQLASQPNVGQPPNFGMNYAVDLVRKSNIAFKRADIVEVFRKLESYGAGMLVNDDRTGTEFAWLVSPVRLAQVATREREAL